MITKKEITECLRNDRLDDWSKNTVLKDAVTTYGYESRSIIVVAPFYRNHCIDSLQLDENGALLVKIYWQGDSTDGDEFMPLESITRDISRWGEFTVPGNGNHDVIRIDREELYDLYGTVADMFDEEKLDKQLDFIRQAVPKVFPAEWRDAEKCLKWGLKYHRDQYNKVFYQLQGIFTNNEQLSEGKDYTEEFFMRHRDKINAMLKEQLQKTL